MKRTIYGSGGHKLFGDNLNYQRNGDFEVFLGLARSLVPDRSKPTAIEGGRITVPGGTSTAIADGLCYWEGGTHLNGSTAAPDIFRLVASTASGVIGESSLAIKLIKTATLQQTQDSSPGLVEVEVEWTGIIVANSTVTVGVDVFFPLTDLRYGGDAIGTIVSGLYSSAYIAANFSSGLGITPQWLGWAIADGSNGTANLVDRTLYGGAASIVGDTGGNASTTLSLAQLPAHNHLDNDVNGFNKVLRIAPEGGGNLTPVSFDAQSSGGIELDIKNYSSVESRGSGAAIENRMPFTRVVFIQKIR
jgi:hypothetical protein